MEPSGLPRLRDLVYGTPAKLRLASDARDRECAIEMSPAGAISHTSLLAVQQVASHGIWKITLICRSFVIM